LTPFPIPSFRFVVFRDLKNLLLSTELLLENYFILAPNAMYQVLGYLCLVQRINRPQLACFFHTSFLKNIHQQVSLIIVFLTRTQPVWNLIFYDDKEVRKKYWRD
jgi:hypothetical protein